MPKGIPKNPRASAARRAATIEARRRAQFPAAVPNSGVNEVANFFGVPETLHRQDLGGKPMRVEVQDGGSGSWPVVVIDESGDPIARFSYKSDAERFASPMTKPVAVIVEPQGMIELTPELASDMRHAAFVMETVAHMRGMEREYLPIAERLRAAVAGK